MVNLRRITAQTSHESCGAKKTNTDVGSGNGTPGKRKTSREEKNGSARPGNSGQKQEDRRGHYMGRKKSKENQLNFCGGSKCSTRAKKKKKGIGDPHRQNSVGDIKVEEGAGRSQEGENGS